ncbi:hypothetical protein BC939DRAFT_493945 [Gamsiella multidivaricata]|uniref:uncharacterized protein n=1 Tax=Gamsiella multidivaricata TaxID=101098 RepID=UPI00221F2C2E|nr:uncharacterized protein BC939DRAFT_493945 [Gamsiella multidivaricata]KAI7821721.1 hypothetical protein BC939DRAFT_493945 [Gamsiella multidivaricata]
MNSPLPTTMSNAAKERPPAPLDPSGNEVCLLFLKYGKCRYKNRCKKSHILPDKNAPIMRQITSIVTEQSAARTGPKVVFSMRKTSYDRPSQTSAASLNQKLRRISDRLHSGTAPRGHKDGEEDSRGTDQTTPVAPPVSIEMTVTAHPSNDSPTMDIAGRAAIDQDMTGVETAQPVRPSKTKPKRLIKAPSKCLLASLFRTTIPNSSKHRQVPVNTFQIGQPTARIHATKPAIGSILRKSKSKSKSSAQTVHPPGSTAAYSINDSKAASEKIEQWYITNKARIDPTTRRLMVLTKPATVRQKNQLKVMRKHHWECRTGITQQLKRNVPTSFSLKVARNRIDWDKFTSYVTLMIQAAFEMDIDSNHLPLIGTTLCAHLEHKDLSGLACEELLISWGLKEIDARRFSNHLWEVMVSAAGEANIRGGKGVGYQVRQLEDTVDFKRIQSRLLMLNKAPT